MALIKYSEATKTTANSYIDQADTVAYLEDMPTTTAIELWNASTEKDQLLIRATRRVDMFRYTGWLNDDTQSLKFPRSSLYTSDNVLLPRDEVPSDVEIATFEIALFMLENDINATNENLNYERTKVGSVDVTFKKNQIANPANTLLTPYIKGYLSPFFDSSNRLGKN